MPAKSTVERAREDLREGKSPTTAAGESYMKKLIMFAKANTAPGRQSK